MRGDAYAMKTGKKVPTEDPAANPYSHTDDDTTFVYLVNAETGRNPKVYGSSGANPEWAAERYPVGKTLTTVQDTGLGSRHMPAHRVVAVKCKGKVTGTLPTAKTLPYWVAK